MLSLLLVVTTVTVAWTSPSPTSWANTRDLIENAKTIALSVIVSDVCPRRKSRRSLNALMPSTPPPRVLCCDLQVDFVDNNSAFHLKDGSFNEGFLFPDTLHLTRAATNKLVSNFKLDLRQGHTTTQTDHRRRAHTPDTPAIFPVTSQTPLMMMTSVPSMRLNPSGKKLVYKSRPRRQSGGFSWKQNEQKPHLMSEVISTIYK